MPPSNEEIAIESQSNGADNRYNNMQNIPTNSASLTANSDMPFPDVDGKGSFSSDADADDNTDADADDIFTQLDISLTSLDQFKLLLNSDLLDKLGVSSLEKLLDDSFYNEDTSGVDNNMAGEEDEEEEYSDTSQPLSTIESINYDWEDDGSSSAADSGTVQQAKSNETVDKQNTAKLIDMNDRKTPLPSTKPSKLIDMRWPRNRTRGRPRSKPQKDDLKDESESPPQNKPSSPPPQQSNQSESSGGTAKLIDMEWPKNKRGNRGMGRRKDSPKSSPNKQPSPPSQQFSSSRSSDEGHDRKSRKQRQMGKMLKDEKPNSNYEKKASSSSQTLSITTSSEGDSTTASEPKIKKKVVDTTKPSTTTTSRPNTREAGHVAIRVANVHTNYH